jgi:hypothetical protein
MADGPRRTATTDCKSHDEEDNEGAQHARL